MTELYHRLSGAGEALVLIHGNTLDSRMWRGQLDAFSQRFRVVTYDLRGFGRSAVPRQAYSHADDLTQLLDYLEIPRAHILGLSMGGALAIDLALACPAVVRSLVLVGSGLAGHAFPSVAPFYSRVIATAKRAGLDVARSMWAEADLLASAMGQADVAPRLQRMLQDYSGWHWLNDDPRIALDPPAVQRLGEITVPTLVVVGEQDIADFHVVAETLTREIPGAELARVSGAGHLVNMEQPDRFNALVLDFLSRHPDRASRRSA